MTWTPDIVKARFQEAAETERYLPRPRMGTGAGFWPLHQYTKEDREGWDEAAKADNADLWARNRKLTREAISRHDECLVWSMTLLGGETHRHIVWKWAFCQVNGWSFSEACKRRGWVRVTAYRRLQASFEMISGRLGTARTLVRLPDEKWLLQDGSISANRCDRREDVVTAPTAIKFTPGYQTEKSRDLIQTQDDAETFAKFLERRNARMRKINAWRNEAVV
jgi:PAS domain-containing protein